MFKKTKAINKLKHSKVMKEAQTIDFDKEGRAKIDVGLKNANDFFSPFAYKSYELLNTGVVDYIDMCASAIPFDYDLTIDVYTETPTTSAEKKRIKQAIKRHNAEKVVVGKHKIKNSIIKGLLWLIGGLALLLGELFLFKLKPAYGILIDIAGWVFAWDGIEILVSQVSSLRRHLQHNYRLMNAKVHVRQYSKKIQRQFGIGEYEEDDEE